MKLFILLSIDMINAASKYSSIAKANFMTEAAEKDGAVCLDGSAGNYYFAKGEESTKFVMHFEGGGWCWNEEDCWKRRGGNRGSTKNDKSQMDFNKVSFLGNDPKKSPLFFNWNKIYFRYCDGMSFVGNVIEPIVNAHDSSEFMYFRGKRLLVALFESLASHLGLDKATDFVIGGGSAGGLAVFLHSNFIANNFFNLKQTKLVSLPKIGFFIEYNGWNGKTQFAQKMRFIHSMQNVSSKDSESVFAQNIAADIVIPTFVLNSQFDSWQAQNILGTGKSNKKLLNEYGRNFTRILTNDFLAKNSENGGIFGAFIDGCYRHNSNRADYWYELKIDGYTQATAFKQFYNGLEKENNRFLWYQNVTYPCKQCCGKAL